MLPHHCRVRGGISWNGPTQHECSRTSVPHTYATISMNQHGVAPLPKSPLPGTNRPEPIPRSTQRNPNQLRHVPRVEGRGGRILVGERRRQGDCLDEGVAVAAFAR